MKSKIFTILLGICLFAFVPEMGVAQTTGTGSQTNPGTPSGSMVISPLTLAKVIKLGAYQLGVNPDLLWQEYQAGMCLVECLDPKFQIFRVEYGGGYAIILLETSI